MFQKGSVRSSDREERKSNIITQGTKVEVKQFETGEKLKVDKVLWITCPTFLNQ